jgi:hypothetical protein
MKIEQALREACTRVDPPDEFAGRVMSRLGEPMPIRIVDRSAGWRRAMRRLAAAAALAFAIFWARGRVSEERSEMGRQASREVLFALRIASAKVNVAKRGVQQIDRSYE